jgi:Bacterial lectin
MLKLHPALLLLVPIVLLASQKVAIGQSTTPLFRETFRGNILENLGSVTYRITTSRDSSRPANNPLSSQSVCLTASQDTTNTVGNGQSNATNIPGCAPGLSGLPTTGDAIGSGALRLTSNRIGYVADGRDLSGQGERGAFIIDQAFPREDGLIIEFDFFIYNGDSNGTPPSADGLSFFLLDGSTANPTPGAFGGSLGYAQATQGGVQPGASNGFIGIGFDVFGNFSDPGEGRNGGPGRQTDRVVLRGSASKQYPFITNVASSTIIGAGIDDDASITAPKVRDQGTVQGRRARITITPDGFLTVGLSTQTGENVAETAFINVFNTTIDLKQNTPIAGGVDALAPIPNTFKFGFAASTGFSTAIHELRNLIVRPVRPPATTPPGNLSLVKRVTAVTRNGLRTEFNQFTDDPTNTIDNLPGWSQPNASPVGLITVPTNLSVQSNDEIEYTIYYLAQSQSTVPTNTIADVNFCDSIPVNTTYIANSSVINRSGSSDTPFGTFFSPLQPIPNSSPCPSPSNNNGAILYSLGNLSTQAGQNFGYTRFRTRVNGAQP